MPADNPIQGEVTLELNGKPYKLVYDWAALAKFSATYKGQDINMFDPDTLCGVLEIGLAKHHSGDPVATAKGIYAASPPVVGAINAFNLAMQRSYFGHKEPPQDAGANPLLAAMQTPTSSGASAAASDSPSAPESPPASSGRSRRSKRAP